MNKLSDTQNIILGAASQHPNSDVRNHMQHIKSPAIRDKVIESMLKHGLIEEDTGREDLAYVISAAGYEALGMDKPQAEPADEHDAGSDDTENQSEAVETEALPEAAALSAEEAAAETAPPAVTKAEPKPKREGASKKQIMIDLLLREEGVTHQQLMDATGWLKHSVHGAKATISKEQREKHGLTVEGVKNASGKLVYKLVPVEQAQEEGAVA